MIRRHLLVAPAFIAAVAASACSGSRDSTVTGPAMSAASASSSQSQSESRSPRRGPLNIQKDCTGYTGDAHQTCVVTLSNLAAIPAGSVIFYESGAVNGYLDTDIILYAAGRGRNVAFGHCALSLVTGIGTCRFSGGTGTLRGLHAKVAVSPLGWPMFAWDGRYSFSGNDDRED